MRLAEAVPQLAADTSVYSTRLCVKKEKTDGTRERVGGGQEKEGEE